MGGAYGHIMHPYEDISLSFESIKKMIELSLHGKLDHIYEKTDGQNLLITWRDGLKVARNKTHIKKLGMDINEIQFSNSTIKNVFELAAKKLENVFVDLLPDYRYKVFNNGNIFLSVEIIHPTTTNVIPYKSPLLVFQDIRKYDNNGNIISITSKHISKLSELAAVYFTRTGFNIISNPKVNITESCYFKFKLDYFYRIIDTLKKEYNLNDKNTLLDYYCCSWCKFIEQHISISDNIKDKLISRWCFNDKTYSIANIKKEFISNRQYLSWILNTDKISKSINNTFQFPWRLLFLELGMEILKSMHPLLIKEQSYAKKQICDNIIQSIKIIKKTGNPIQQMKLIENMKIVGILGGLKNIIPTEGIIFTFNGMKYKLTGLFSPINQILGIGRY